MSIAGEGAHKQPGMRSGVGAGKGHERGTTQWVVGGGVGKGARRFPQGVPKGGFERIGFGWAKGFGGHGQPHGNSTNSDLGGGGGARVHRDGSGYHTLEGEPGHVKVGGNFNRNNIGRAMRLGKAAH